MSMLLAPTSSDLSDVDATSDTLDQVSLALMLMNVHCPLTTVTTRHLARTQPDHSLVLATSDTPRAATATV